MSNEEKAHELSKLLKYIANKLDNTPDLLDNIKIDIKMNEEKHNPINKDIDMLKFDNDKEIIKQLKKENIETLKYIISKYNLDRTKKSLKLEDKHELIKFIVKRLNDRYHKGESFSSRNNV
jgi:signal recognition particle subunit SEC65